VATITLNGREIEAPVGAPLVEVIKNAGVFISNLCYIDDLPPYAGCRTCLVEIEGAPGLHLSCTTRVIDGMAVRTDTAQAAAARQAVLSHPLLPLRPLPHLPPRRQVQARRHLPPR